ncbi:hypothetical protein BC628DRAFT_1382310 [Trametes gibbosa]|nr:hypothetical protein BC628DRAFT_1382310 [Trametes gibbosa]
MRARLLGILTAPPTLPLYMQLAVRAGLEGVGQRPGTGLDRSCADVGSTVNATATKSLSRVHRRGCSEPFARLQIPAYGEHAQISTAGLALRARCDRGLAALSMYDEVDSEAGRAPGVGATLLC